MLFCSERVDWVYKGLFGKAWKQDHYIRTSCYRTAAARAVVPESPEYINAKAILLGSVPSSEQW